MIPGDFVICNDIIGCVQKVQPLTLLCQDGKIRQVCGEAHIIMSGQQAALITAEKLIRRITNGNS